uniref:Alpha/beta hydrolase n=1 Tax=uncultured microorganism TaxID=358574 RepID=K0J3R9_9ZZZZ|nr:alpha/beta hydrolase [uncultured microorganism]
MSKKSLIYRGESHALDEKARSSAPGKFVELADGLVHYKLAGSPEAQTVILVPGFSVPYPIWDPTFEAMVEAGFQVLRYDLYGRGYSDRPDTFYDQDMFDRQLWTLLDVLGINKRIDLVGLSLGGAISVIFSDRHPESVRKLCLIDPAGLPWKQSLPARLVKTRVLGELIMGLLGDKVLVSNLSDFFYGDRRYVDLKQEFLNQMQYVGFKKALLSTLRSGVATGAVEAYARVGKRGCPVMLIWGREDRVVPFELSKRVMELIPNIEFHAIDEAAHIPHFERPEVVNPLLLDFLSG